VTTPSTPPGWYPDPAGGPGYRYWNGITWGEVAAVGVGQSGHSLQPTELQNAKPGLSKGAKIGFGIGAFAIAIVTIGSIGNNDKGSSPSPGSPGGIASRTAIAPPTTIDSGFTPAQDNAIAKAESYLDYSAFSKQGLILQLEYDKFTTADATFAVAHIESTGGVDWREQAVRKAKSYMDYSAFSLDGLIRQLEYDKFTLSEAQYGARTAYGG
jgi:hypothetical protein